MTQRLTSLAKVAAPAAVAVGLLAATEGVASAQEIQLTGPLAGAPAVRNLRLHRKQRLELSPALSFTLLDEFQRTILVGARINYNITDWLAVGAWGAFGAVKQPTALAGKIEDSNKDRFSPSAPNFNTGQGVTGRTLVRTNVGEDFGKQLGAMNWVFAPQITAVPFRGKLSLFQKVFVDTDAYFFVGPAFVGLTERKDCGDKGQASCDLRKDPNNPDSIGKTKDTQGRTAIAPTFGLGLSVYTGQWTSFGVEWRALPFSWNTAGFDTRGAGENARFPDQKVNSKDREFKFNQMITLSFGMYFPRQIKQSE